MAPRPSEDDLIARYFAPLAGAGGLGLRDDAALIRPPAGRELVVTTDALVAGVHFFADDPPGAIARKALRVNLSDLAAKGAAPLGFVLDLALPGDWTSQWLEAFAAGLGEDASAYSCPLLGGDTVKTPGPLTLAISAFGAVAPSRFVARGGARAGDTIYVTGSIGDAALGLRLRRGERLDISEAHRDFLVDRYLLPQPRLALAPALTRFANAGMDVSDGLVGDLTKLLRVSGLGARIELAHIPLSPATAAAVAADPALFAAAVTGGDDYELIVTAPPESAKMLEDAATQTKVPLTRIGETLADAGAPRFVDRDGRDVAFVQSSFRHF